MTKISWFLQAPVSVTSVRAEYQYDEDLGPDSHPTSDGHQAVGDVPHAVLWT